MKNCCFVVLVVGVGLFACLSMAGQEPTKLAMAEELLTLMHVPELIPQSLAASQITLFQAEAQQKAKAIGHTNTPPVATSEIERMRAVIAHELSWDKIKDGYITQCASTFTGDELKELIAFFKTPVGQSYVTKMPKVTGHSADLLRELMPRLMSMTVGPTTAPKSKENSNSGEAR